MVSEMPGTGCQAPHDLIARQHLDAYLTAVVEYGDVTRHRGVFGSKSGGGDIGQRTLISGRLEK